MRKEDGISLIVYIAMVVVVLCVGFFVIAPNGAIISQSFGSDSVILVIIGIVVGVIFNVIILELGHVIGAKIGGYHIVSVNILGFAFFKKVHDGKVSKKFKFPKPFNGLTGQTIIKPKSLKSNFKPIAFIPLMFVLLEVVAVALLFFFVPDKISGSINPAKGLVVLKYLVLIVTVIGLIISLYNLVPFRLDSLNDGYQLAIISKKENIGPHNEMLRIKADTFLGVDYRPVHEFDELTDYTLKVSNLHMSILYLEGEIDETAKILKKYYAKDLKISNSTKDFRDIVNLLLSLTKRTLNDAVKLYENLTPSAKKELKAQKTALTLGTYLLYVVLIEKSESELIANKQRADKFFKEFSEELNIKEDKAVYEIIYNEVCDLYPNLEKDLHK